MERTSTRPMVTLMTRSADSVRIASSVPGSLARTLAIGEGPTAPGLALLVGEGEIAAVRVLDSSRSPINLFVSSRTRGTTRSEVGQRISSRGT